MSDTTGNNLAIGEQAQFRLSFVLPSGTSPGVKVRDVVPAGFRVISRDAPTMGSAISGCSSTASPALPINGATTLLWDFSASSCVVSAGAAAIDRTITFDYVLQVQNISANNSNDTLVNSATFEISSTESTPQSVTMTLKEPALLMTKVASPSSNVDAGDEITYTVTLQNTGNATAYDIALDDTLPTGVDYIASSTNLTATSSLITSLNEPDTGTASHLKWGRISSPAQILDLLAGESITFTYKVTVLDTVEPSQTLGNSIDLTYTSIPNSSPTLSGSLGSSGAADGERDGSEGSSGSTNNYAQNKTSSVTINNTYSIAKVASGDTLTPSGFRIGDIATYTVTATLQQGKTDNFKILDTLPDGLEYISTTSITPAVGVTWTGSPNTPTGTTTKTWDFGDVTVVGSNGVGSGTITLVYTARIKDDSNNATTGNAITKSNLARATYDLASTASTTTSNSTANISLKQPSLSFDKTLLTPVSGNVIAGQTVKYRLRVTNTGTGPAYNVIVQDTLPEGMRQSTPATAVSSTLNGAAYSDVITSYVSGTGVTTWKLKDSDPSNKIDAGEEWVLEYTAQVDAQAGAAQTLTNSAQVTEYYSKAESDTQDRRQYSATALDSVDVTTPTPGTLSKTLTSPVSPNVTIGQAVQYVIRVPSTPLDAALYDVNVLDSLPTQFTAINVTATLLTPNGGVTITDNTSGHAVSVNYDTIPVGNQAVVTIDAILANDLGNAETQTRSNQASYNWKSTPLGSPTTVGPTPAVDFTIVEPDLTIDKTLLSTNLSDPLRGLQTGDTVTYRITVSNSGTENAAAYDFNIVDTAEDPLVFDAIVGGSNPGTPTGGVLSSTTRTYTWAAGSGDMPTTLNPGDTYSFDVRFILGTVQPYQTLTNSVETNYSSRPGVDANERSYNTADPTPVDVQTGNILLSKTLVGSVTDFNVGEEIKYQLKFEPLSGRVNSVRILDQLPTGLSYRGYTLSQNNVKRAGTASDPVTVLSEPTPSIDGSSTLTFNLGGVEGTGAGAEVILEITIRVDDIVGNVNGTVIKNEAQTKFDNPDNPGNDITLDASGEPNITVSEPDSALALEGPTTLTLTQPAQFTARFVNSGTGKAYQPIVRIDIPTPFNSVDPTSISSLPISVSVSGVRSFTLNPSEYSVTYTPGATGSLTFTFTGANAYIAPSETMTLLFPLDVNDDTLDASVASLVGTITKVNSSDTSASTDADNRIYTTVFGVGTQGTAVAAAPDDETDDHEITVQSPILQLTKAVNKSSYTYSSETAPHKLTYTLTLSNSGSAAATVTEIRDILNTSYFKASTLSNSSVVASDGVAGSLSVDGTGPSGSGVGEIIYTGDTLDAGSNVVISYDIELKDYLPSGTVVQNQATATIDGFTSTYVSDSTNSADNNATEEGNSGSSATDDDPTLTTIVSAPVITHQKSSTDVNGGSLEVGDVLQYTITLSNSGTEHLTNAKLKDSIPTNTTYVPSSTTLNGVAVSDVSGNSPLATIAGMQIEGVNGVADGAGWIKVGSTATVSFQVTIASSASNGTLIINQAQLTGQGEGGNVIPTKVSDDPSTSTLDDPTIDVVGTGASLQTSKTVSISQDLKHQ
ncbi:MAG: isopeptide-forming domain-containing fimbrial protein [Bdellovibrionota bacterium]